MSLSNLSVNEKDERFQVKLDDCDLSDETSESFLFLKAQIEEILGRNGYEVPVTAGGIRSLEDVPVYSRGVKKGQKDLWGMTTDPGEPGKRPCMVRRCRKLQCLSKRIPVFWIL